MRKSLLFSLCFCIIAGCTTNSSHERTFRIRPEEGDATSVIQKKLDKCFLAGGGKVILSEGVYNVGGLRLRSNTTLYLESGATLLGSRNCDDYDIMSSDRLQTMDPEDTCGRSLAWTHPSKRKNGKAPHITVAGSRWNDAIIRLYKAENAAIIGEPGSIIDGQNSYDPIGEEHYRGVHGISAHKSRNLVFKGYTIQHTGNWAHLMRNCSNVQYDSLTILGGHDGVHISTCDSVSITNCVMKTGDDCVAGFDNRWIKVEGCTLNTACSAFRFGGTHMSVDNCLCYGPGEYPIRGSLTKEQKEKGEMGENNGRRNMLSVFTYYADKTLPIRETPGDIQLSNLKCENIDRFFHYNFSGNETWQLAMPFDSIIFKNVTANGIKLPICCYSTESAPFSLTLENCDISFRESVPEVIRGAHIKSIKLDNVNISGTPASTPLVRFWKGEKTELEISSPTGVKEEAVQADGPFKVSAI